jgi:peptidoglycan-N-acetylglucosamine deacetylase
LLIAVSISILVAIGLPVLYLGLPLVVRRYLRSKLLGIIHQSGRVCLTFDDGPDPRSTPLILDILKEAGFKATFFVLGRNAEKHPELIQRMLDEGHELGEHGYAHVNALASAPWSTWKDLSKGGRMLDDFRAPTRNRCLRPPYGKLNPASLLYIWSAGKRMIMWDIDPMDYRQQTSEEIAASVTQQMSAGCVVLMHDGRANNGSDPSITVGALKLIVQAMQEKGLSASTVREAFETNN